MSDLRKKTVNGLIWTFAQQFGVQSINFIVSIILARLLLPAEFGLIGLIAIFMAIGNALVDSGMSASLIRTEHPTDTDYSTVFFANLSISIIVYFAVFFGAPAIGDFFDQPILKDLIRVYCLTFIIRAFSTVQGTKLNKEMNFKKQMMINLPSLIAGGILGIVLAYNGFGVWSLVYMNMFQTAIATLQLWLFSKWAPTFVFDRECISRHLGFGYKLTLSGIFNSLVNNAYNITIGKLFSVAQLGFYVRAKSMQELPVVNISNALNKVTYPMFAKLQNDNAKLREVYEKLTQVIFFVIVPILVLAIVIAEPLFNFLLTSKWLPAVPYFKILCLAGIFTPINAYNLNILLVKGKSDNYLKLESIKNTLMLLSLLSVIPFGIYGLLWSLVIISVITFIINSYYCSKVLELPMGRQVVKLVPILLISLVCYGITRFAYAVALDFLKTDFLQLVSVSCLFAVSYFALCFLFRISALNFIRQIIFKSRVKQGG